MFGSIGIVILSLALDDLKSLIFPLHYVCIKYKFALKIPKVITLLSFLNIQLPDPQHYIIWG